MELHALGESLALNPMDPKDLLQTFGLVGVWAILFAETGLLVGFFFPGDSLLFLAGVAASPVANSIFGDGTQLSYVGLLIGAPVCAILGAQLGHLLGAKYGRRMFDKPDSKLFKREYVEKAEYYFEKFGPAKAVVLARFIPIVRTFLNPVAGTLGMPAKKFFIWNVVGAVLWTDGIIIIGHTLAQQIYDAIGDKIDHYILPVVALIVLISVLPILIEILRERKAKKKAAAEGHASTEPEPATAIGVVAAATIAGLVDSIHDDDNRPQSGAPQSQYPSSSQQYSPPPGHYPPASQQYPSAPEDHYPSASQHYSPPPGQYPPAPQGQFSPSPHIPPAPQGQFSPSPHVPPAPHGQFSPSPQVPSAPPEQYPPARPYPPSGYPPQEQYRP